MSAVTDITCPPSSTFFTQIALLEASPAKCIGLSKLFSFGKGFFWKLNTKIQFVILLTEETDDAFRVACAGCRSSSFLSSDKPVARVPAFKCPSSRGLKLVLLGLLLLVSTAFSACKEVTGLRDILASLFRNLQNSAKGE